MCAWYRFIDDLVEGGSDQGPVKRCRSTKPKITLLVFSFVRKMSTTTYNAPNFPTSESYQSVQGQNYCHVTKFSHLRIYRLRHQIIVPVTKLLSPSNLLSRDKIFTQTKLLSPRQNYWSGDKSCCHLQKLLSL